MDLPKKAGTVQIPTPHMERAGCDVNQAKPFHQARRFAMGRFEAILARTFTSLGITLMFLSILIVPADAFAYTAGQCSPCAQGLLTGVARGNCAAGCCNANCADNSCKPQCCADGCGTDTICLATCQAGSPFDCLSGCTDGFGLCITSCAGMPCSGSISKAPPGTTTCTSSQNSGCVCP